MRRLIESPYRNIFLASVVGLVIVWIHFRRSGSLGASPFWILVYLLAFFIILILWLFFFSQFVLPVKNFKERLTLFDRLILYILGMHGPAILLQNGKIKPHKSGAQRKGPGVIILDAASAAILRRNDRFTRAVGPGVVFTDRDEYLEGDKSAVDLRLQKERIGPVVSPPARTGRKKPDPETLEIIRRQRMETRAITRNSIEIVPKITVTFKIDCDFNNGETGFGYDQSAVAKAIIGQNIDANQPPDDPDRLRDWCWIPPHLAADVWKETISKFTLDELFDARPGHTPALATVMQVIEERLTHEQCHVYTDYGVRTDTLVDSREFQMLTERGIRVCSVEIRDLDMPEVVEKQLFEHWRDNWLDQARRESASIDTQESYLVADAQVNAQDSFAMQTARNLPTFSNLPINCRNVMIALLESNIAIAERNPRVHQETQTEIEQMRELIDILGSWGETA